MVSPAAAPLPPERSHDDELLELFRECSGELRGYLRVRGCPESLLDDVIQESFIAVRGRWGHVRGYGRPKAYVYKVAGRVLGKMMQQQAAVESPGDPAPHLLAFPEPSDAIAAADRRALAMALLRQLPPRQRQVAYLRIGAGFTVEETATILSIAVGTVKSTLHDAMARMEEIERKTRGDEWRAQAP